MKKTIITLTIVAFTLYPALAQDTVYLNAGNIRQLDNYFVPMWPDTFLFHQTNKVYIGVITPWGGFGKDQAKQEAWKMYTDDTLQVYGIAASVNTFMTKWQNNPSYAHYIDMYLAAGIDTSQENSYEFYRLYEADPDSLRQIGEDLKIHVSRTPVAYYFDLNLYNCVEKWEPLPMYERFFSEPVTVTDSFYIGRCYGPWISDPLDIFIYNIANGLDPNAEYDYAAYFDFSYYDYNIHDSVSMLGWHYLYHRMDIPILFPIIAPPDTTEPEDTVGIARLVYRYTSVSPNPATQMVKVASSFGLQHIEAYNIAGTRVYDEKVSGMTATFDVTAWPKGMYVLRITTSAGTTVKKLLVDRR